MEKECPECGREYKENETFCECGSLLVLKNESKRKKQSILDKDVYFYLKKQYKELYALGYKNVSKIDIFDGDFLPGERNERWIKESSALILKEGRAFLSVEMMSSTETPPIVVAGNILIHSIAESAIVKIKGNLYDDEESFILDDKKYPRFLLILIPDPPADKKSSKRDQMQIIEPLIKNTIILENSSLENFKICLVSEFEKALQELIQEEI